MYCNRREDRFSLQENGTEKKHVEKELLVLGVRGPCSHSEDGLQRETLLRVRPQETIS